MRNDESLEAASAEQVAERRRRLAARLFSSSAGLFGLQREQRPQMRVAAKDRRRRQAGSVGLDAGPERPPRWR